MFQFQQHSHPQSGLDSTASHEGKRALTPDHNCRNKRRRMTVIAKSATMGFANYPLSHPKIFFKNFARPFKARRKVKHNIGAILCDAGLVGCAGLWRQRLGCVSAICHAGRSTEVGLSGWKLRILTNASNSRTSWTAQSRGFQMIRDTQRTPALVTRPVTPDHAPFFKASPKIRAGFVGGGISTSANFSNPKRP